MTESPEKKTVAERVETLSDEVLNSIQAGQRTAMDAVRKFVDTLDKVTPNIVDEFLRKVIGSAGEALCS